MKSSLTRFFARAGIAALCALSLSGCIDSGSPILVDAEPVFGQQLNLQFYGLHKGYAHDEHQATYRWNGAFYALARGRMRDFSGFSAHPFENGDYILQATPSNHARITEYAVMHKLAEGVFQVLPIDQDDADEQTRVLYCKRVDKSACRIETRDELFAFARFTAARDHDNGGLVLRLPDAPERRKRPTRRRR